MMNMVNKMSTMMSMMMLDELRDCPCCSKLVHASGRCCTWCGMHLVAERFSWGGSTGVMGQTLPAANTFRTSYWALASLVLSLLGLITVGITSIPAIMLGHLGRHTVRARTDQIGDRLATAGLVIGYATLGAIAAVLATIVLM